MAKRGMCVAKQPIEVNGKLGKIVQVTRQEVVISVNGQQRPPMSRRAFDEARLKGTITYTDQAANDETMPDPMQLLDERDHADIARRLAYVEELELWEKKGSITTRRDVIAVVSLKIDDPRPPSPNTLHNWYSAYTNAGGSPLALLSRHRCRGNSHPRLSPLVLRLIGDSIDGDFLTTDRLTRRDAYEIHFRRRCEAAGLSEAEIPSYKTYCNYINKRDELELVRYRIGEVAARHKGRHNQGGYKTTHALERVELDGTQLDVLLLSDDKTTIVGRPYIVLLRDHYTKMIVGYYVHLHGKESALAAIKALECAIRPKAEFHRQFPDVRHRWLAYGCPELLVMDASRGFQSHDMAEFCWSLAISTDTTKTKQPWLKGSVESVFNFLTNSLQPLPGALRPRTGSLPASYDAVKNSCITVSKFDSMLARWVVDIANQKPSERDGFCPDDRWRESVEVYVPMEPDNLVDLRRFGVKRVSRVIHENKGVLYKWLYWDSPELQKLGRMLDKGERLVVRIDPDDLSYIFVENPIEGQLLKVPSCYPDYVAGLTLKDHEHIRRQARARFKHHPNHQRLRLAKAEIYDEARQAHQELADRAHRTGRPQRRPQGTALPLDRAARDGVANDGEFANLLAGAAGFSDQPGHRMLESPEESNPDTPPTHPSADGFNEKLDDEDDFDAEET
ncbi:transposase family protein [Ectothiorhodospiraceae bacterium WFHF3C12]|nr:transposase family protein [Ectothiorhodospiraceae bacterium WFHF3C12]